MNDQPKREIIAGDDDDPRRHVSRSQAMVANPTAATFFIGGDCKNDVVVVNFELPTKFIILTTIQATRFADILVHNAQAVAQSSVGLRAPEPIDALHAEVGHMPTVESFDAFVRNVRGALGDFVAEDEPTLDALTRIMKKFVGTMSANQELERIVETKDQVIADAGRVMAQLREQIETISDATVTEAIGSDAMTSISHTQAVISEAVGNLGEIMGMVPAPLRERMTTTVESLRTVLSS